MAMSSRNQGSGQHAADGIERLDAAGEEHAGGQREDAEHHVAGEHVAVKSDGEREPADAGGDELQEPDDRHHDLRKPRRSEGLQVGQATLGLDAPDVEVDKRDGSERPGHRDGAVGVLQPGIRPTKFEMRMKKNSVARKGTCFLKP